MISIILILLFVFSVLSVPVCHGVISGLYLYGMKIFPGLFISFILTNKVLNDFLIALGTGMICSSLTALLIDRSHEKQNAVISNMMKRQILYDMLLNLRYWINSDDPIEIFEKRHDNEYIDERITECQRSLNFAIPFLSSDEYQAISTIEIQLKNISNDMQKLHEKEHYLHYKDIYEILLYNNPILDNPFYSYQYENRLTQLYDIASEVAYEICMSVIIHNMNINYIKNQLQLFDDIETENV